MTKPESFEINSDYMSVAEYGKNQFDFVIPAGSYTIGYLKTYTQDFNIESQDGAIFRMLLQKDNGPVCLGNEMIWVESTQIDPYGNLNEVLGMVTITRVNSNKLRATFNIGTQYIYAPTDYVSHTIHITVSWFKPPNLT